MLSILISIIGMIITIVLVVGIHEFGHFIIARLCGIKILRFSIGFGKALFTWHGKTGTEYVLAAIPLGGYVKMLDESEGNVPENERHLAFNQQPIYKKAAVIAAGPIANLLFAIFIYWLLFIIGFNTIKPLIGSIAPNSISAQAGLKPQEEIIQIDNEPTTSWASAILRIITRSGDHDKMRITTQPYHTNTTQTYTLDLSNWHMDELKPDPLVSLGITPYEPKINPVIHTIQNDSPAAASALKVNDKIIAIDTQPISDWMDMLTIIGKSHGKTLAFKIIRDGKTITLPVDIGTKHNFLYQPHGYLGISPTMVWQPELIKHNQYGPIAAIPYALHETYTFIHLNVIVIGKMITGKVSLHSLGGPITIFESAGSALNQGLIPFLGFLAFLSISIGFINVIPIPGLDGGHLLFQLIEFIMRRPISERVQILFYRIGMILLLMLIVQAVTNDIMRLT
jgi:regulator of sigma E protease